ncbi:protein CMSS1 isoform X2 [Electrophorus electricus]|uniref:protein CMSS1 isoform X2 n=1 Tax=Electrophorus electricus TaxID=8005 RepID=UPI0015D0C280|nr:protein CMSS1 isoform X2 [Electrophorus electricus]
MGDDLGNEWWTQGDYSDVSNVEEETQPKAKGHTKQNAKKRKLTSSRPDKAKKKPKECLVTKEKAKGEEGSKKPNRRRKKTITDVLASSDPAPGSPADLRSLLQSHFGATRSVIEQEERFLPESCFLMSNDLSHSLSSYLKEVCPKWSKVQKQHTQTSSVLLLIVCGSALRTIELIKQLTTFKGQAKVLKLFARHIKVEEHMKLLSKGVTHIGVGTPGRVSVLIEKEGLHLQALRYLVFDWNYRDRKQRKMVDIPEVKGEFVRLMETGIIKKCQEGAVKIGLF